MGLCIYTISCKVSIIINSCLGINFNGLTSLQCFTQPHRSSSDDWLMIAVCKAQSLTDLSQLPHVIRWGEKWQHWMCCRWLLWFAATFSRWSSAAGFNQVCMSQGNLTRTSLNFFNFFLFDSAFSKWRSWGWHNYQEGKKYASDTSEYLM